jgi:hypothetical protein
MATNYYVFADKFTAPCNVETAFEYLHRVEEYTRWWGKVYKKIERLKDGAANGVGTKYRLTFAGFLPYTLTLENEETLVDRPFRFEFVASGDLEGKGAWIFTPVANGTEVTFDWRVAANKKVIRIFSFLLKPLFRANHAYCVRAANEGIRKDLAMKQNVAVAT